MLRAPEPLNPDHDIAGFDCGVASLNTWLARRAAANQVSGASGNFVVCEASKVVGHYAMACGAVAPAAAVVGHYAMACGAVAPAAAPGRFRRNMPDPVPVVVLGRLAIATCHHGQGLGRALFQDAAHRVMHAADAIGMRGLVVHALSEEAKAFYLRLGLDESPLDPMTLMITVADPLAAMQG